MHHGYVIGIGRSNLGARSKKGIRYDEELHASEVGRVTGFYDVFV